MRYRPTTSPLLICLILAITFSARSHGEDEPASASDDQPEVVKLAGVLEATTAHEITVDTKHIQSLVLEKIVDHGAEVSKGQNLVWLETKEVDKQIKAAQANLQLAELTFQDEQFAQEQFIESQKLDRAAAERNFQKAKEAFDNFSRVDRERSIESAKFSLKNSQASFENALEELTQLEQMYKEDDLTEESEEIVLKRAKLTVENAKFRLAGTKISTARTLEQGIPRNQEEQEDAMARAKLAYAKSIRDLNSARRKRDIEMRQKQEKFKQTQDDFKALEAERKRLVLQAPHAGIVFHGKLNRGKISDKPSPLAPGGKVTAEQVLLTVAVPSKLQIRTDLAEKDFGKLAVGMKGTVKLAADPDRKVNATIKSISTVPYAAGKYDCVLSVKLPKGEIRILPGMTCSVEFEITP